MKPILFLLFAASLFFQSFAQTPDTEIQSLSLLGNGIYKGYDGLYYPVSGSTVGNLGNVYRIHTGISNNFFTMPLEPPSTPASVEIVKVFVKCDVSYITGDSIFVYAGTTQYTDLSQAWNSYSSMVLVAKRGAQGTDDIEVTGSALTTMKDWLDDRSTSKKKIYISIKMKNETTHYGTVTNLGMRVQYRYKYTVTVDLDRQYSASVGTIDTSQLVSQHPAAFYFNMNQSVTITLNPTARIDTNYFVFDRMVIDNSTITQRVFPLQVTQNSAVSVHFVPGISITLENKLEYLDGTTEGMSGTLLRASLSGVELATLSSGNSTVVPQDVGIEYRTLHGNNGEDLTYKSSYKVKHRDWNSSLGTFLLSNTRTSHYGFTNTAWYRELQSAAIDVQLDGIPQSNIATSFKDPWRVIDNSQPGSWITYNAPASLGIGNDGSTIVGVIKEVAYDSQYPQNAHYEVSAPSGLSWNGAPAPFYCWQASGAYAYNTGNVTTPIMFQSPNATIGARYKAHLGTGAPALSDAKNQRRIASNGSDWLMVYESMGDIWMTTSGDNGTSWTTEIRLNDITGQATNPTISNTVDRHATIVWTENNQGVVEMHLQNVSFNTGIVWYGWQPTGTEPRGTTNHRTFNTIQLGNSGYPTAWRARTNSRPSIFVESNLSKIHVASERNGSGIMWFEVVLGPSFLSDAYLVKQGATQGGVPVSSNTSDFSPVIVSYPAAYGFPASFRIYYLAAGYASGYRIAQWNGGSTSLITGPYGEYTYYSLQAATSPASAAFVLTADSYVVNGYQSYRSTCVFTKPTYGSGAPSLSTSYNYGYQPTIMCESGGFGTPPWEVNFKYSDGLTYKASGGSLTQIGANVAGVFARERVTSTHSSMVVRSNSTPAAIQYYSGSGSLSKGASANLAVSIRSFRYWNDRSGDPHMAVIDFGDAEAQVIDSLETGDALCAVKILNTPSGILCRQVDSLTTSLAIDVVRDGQAIRSYSPASWAGLSVSALGNLEPSDIIVFRAPSGSANIRGYEEITLGSENLNKGQSEDIVLTSSLIPRDFAMSSFPNPFNPITKIQIEMPLPGEGKLAVYDVLGREVVVLLDGPISAGLHTYNFGGVQLQSGIYLARFTVAPASGKPFEKTIKLQLVK